jgi:hypothetical protein
MLNDELNRNNLNRDPAARGRSTGSMMIAALSAIAVLALLWAWAPWGDNSRSAVTGTGTTVGSSTARPGAPTTPVTPTAPASNR